MSLFVNQWSQKKTFSVLAIMLGVLCAVPLYLYVQASYKSSQAVSRVANGLEPIKAVLVAIDATQQHRGLTSMVLNGNASTDAQRWTKQQEVARAYKTVGEIIAQQNNKQLAEKWQSVNVAWPAVADKIGQKTISSKESFAAHSQLIAGLQDINDQLIKNSGLNTDSDTGNHHVVKATLIQSPELVETMARIRGQGAGHLSAGVISQDERAAMAAMHSKAQELYGEVSASLAKATSNDSTLQHQAANTRTEGAKALSVVQGQILKLESLNLSSTEYFAQLTAAIDAQAKLNENALKAMETQLREREQRLVLSLN